MALYCDIILKFKRNRKHSQNSPDCRGNPFVAIFLRHKRLERKAGIAFPENARRFASNLKKHPFY